MSPQQLPAGGRKWAVCLLGLVCAAQLTASQADIREFSCAAFPEDLSERTLIDRYGAANVMRAPVIGGDDGPQPGTIVFPGDDDLQLEIAWYDPETRTRPYWIRTRGDGGRWKTTQAITVGMDLRAIEQMNGLPFRLNGFSSENQGRIRSWGNGRLRSDDTRRCRLGIHLQPPAGTIVDPQLGRQVRRSGDYSSGHPAMQAINPRVVEMYLSYSLR